MHGALQATDKLRKCGRYSLDQGEIRLRTLLSQIDVRLRGTIKVKVLTTAGIKLIPR